MLIIGDIMLKYKVKTCGQILLIPIEDIIPPGTYMRSFISSEEITRLSESIKENGILNPVSVRSNDDGTYMIISGERRRQAAILAGLSFLPCIVMQGKEEECVIMNISDNIHRRNLHYLEEAEIIDYLRDYLSVEEISSMLSIPEGQILSRIRLLTLPDNIKWKIISNSLSETIANQLCRLTDTQLQNDITDILISSDISFGEALRLLSEPKSKTVFIAHYKDYTIFENTIEHAVETMSASGIRVDISKKSDSKRISYSIVIDKMV